MTLAPHNQIAALMITKKNAIAIRAQPMLKITAALMGGSGLVAPGTGPPAPPEGAEEPAP